MADPLKNPLSFFELFVANMHTLSHVVIFYGWKNLFYTGKNLFFLLVLNKFEEIGFFLYVDIFHVRAKNIQVELK